MSTVGFCSSSSPCPLCQMHPAPTSFLHPATISNRRIKSRPKPMSLPEIDIPDPNDWVAVKRANNTMAARKSRQKQIDHLERMERLVLELSAENNHWKNWATLRQESFEWTIPQWMEDGFSPGEQQTTSNQLEVHTVVDSMRMDVESSMGQGSRN